MKIFQSAFFVTIIFLVSCSQQAQATALVVTAMPATATLLPTETSLPATTTSLPPAETATSVSTQDPTLFGAIGTNEIQAFALEPVANAIFTKVMDGFAAAGSVSEYQVTGVTIFPGGNGLLAEIIYNVKSADAVWLADGGTPAADGWINGNCSRFDFVTTDIEYQLKNRRLCS